ncbi:branched-chain-amino-acid transaminase [Pseudoalteromonas sp. R3]|uniref:branched-chain-amino-acid transaminase n=1 Tax=Pseudoalteromonas sp. R3 TaxID=1709477 RepID=UPI0006B51E46|nr:branched-chain-amino-acid transaminase [Pseudoalteromonas sp. R3]AZZ97412.1 branched-chain-amino-acid transaminase [Pseudoalteromonas sp. R3]
MIFWKDGQFVEKQDAVVSVLDHGLLYGDGIFEGFRFFGDAVLFAEEHVDRLYQSAKAIDLSIQYSKTDMLHILNDVAKSHQGDGYIRLIVTRGEGKLGIDPRSCQQPTVILIASPIKLYDNDAGIKLIISSVTRNRASALDPRIKSLNYLNNILAKMEATALGAEEAVMLNGEGNVSECTTENLFIVSGNQVSYPPLKDGALDGITKNICIELLKRSHYDLVERSINTYDLKTADEILLTGTAAGVVRAASLNGRHYTNCACFEFLSKQYEAYIANLTTA